MCRNGLFERPTAHGTGINPQVAGNFGLFVGFECGSEVARRYITVGAGVKDGGHFLVHIWE